MLKLIQGIADYHEKVRPEYREVFARLALEQKPDALLVACSDSRVAPNLFASTEPGDVFVVRNVGNLIPPFPSESAHAEAAAVEFAVLTLNVRDLIICGHSQCGAMKALLDPGAASPGVRQWLQYAQPALERINRQSALHPGLEPVDQLSQCNVLFQLEQVLTYPEVRARVESGALRLHGWWFDIANAEVLHFDGGAGRFVVIDEQEAERLLEVFGQK